MPLQKASPHDRLMIESVRYTPCIQRQQDPTWKFARSGIPQIHGWIVPLTTRDGAQGWGHVLATPIAGPDIARTQAALETACALLPGQNALDQQSLHRLLAPACEGLPCVLSGLTSTALELAARSLDLPLHALLGSAVRRQIPVARLIPIKEPEAMATEALRLQTEGYRTLKLKLKLNGSADLDLARVAAVRAAVGPALTLTVDVNQAYDADTAIDVCQALAHQ